MVRGFRRFGLPKTMTSSPTAKMRSRNGRFHQRQWSRAEPSSITNSYTVRAPPRRRFTPAATILPKTVALLPSSSSRMVMNFRRSS